MERRVGIHLLALLVVFLFGLKIVSCADYASRYASNYHYAQSNDQITRLRDLNNDEKTSTAAQILKGDLVDKCLHVIHSAVYRRYTVEQRSENFQINSGYFDADDFCFCGLQCHDNPIIVLNTNGTIHVQGTPAAAPAPATATSDAAGTST